MDKQFHPTLYNERNYLFMPGVKLTRLTKGPLQFELGCRFDIQEDVLSHDLANSFSYTRKRTVKFQNHAAFQTIEIATLRLHKILRYDGQRFIKPARLMKTGHTDLITLYVDRLVLE